MAKYYGFMLDFRVIIRIYIFLFLDCKMSKHWQISIKICTFINIEENWF